MRSTKLFDASICEHSAYHSETSTVNTSYNGAALIAAGVERINYIGPEPSAENRERIMAQLVSFKADVQLGGDGRTRIVLRIVLHFPSSRDVCICMYRGDCNG